MTVTNTPMFEPSEVIETMILIYGSSASGASYGRSIDGKVDGQVFLAQGIVNRFELCPGDTLKVRVVPNYPDRIDSVAWRVIYAYPKEEAVAEKEPSKATSLFGTLYSIAAERMSVHSQGVRTIPVQPAETPAERVKKMTDEAVKEMVRRVAEDGRVWSSRAMFEHIFDREPDYKDDYDRRTCSTINNTLRSMATKGLLAYANLYKGHDTAYATYFCADIGMLKPEGF